MSDFVRSLSLNIRRLGIGPVVIGLLIWAVGLGAALWVTFGLERTSQLRAAALASWRMHTQRTYAIDLTFPQPIYTAIGDAVYIQSQEGVLRRVGQVWKVAPTTGGPARRGGWVDELTIQFFVSGYADPVRFELVYDHARPSAEWVARMLLPPEKLSEISGRLAEIIERDGPEIGRVGGALVVRSLRDSIGLLASQIPDFVVEHQEEIQELWGVVREEWIEQWSPMIAEAVLPVAKEELEPIFLDTIMPDLLARIPWWGLARRAIQDVAGGDRLRREVMRIIQEEWAEVLTDHSGLIAEAVGKIGRRLADHPKVEQTINQSLADLVASPEVRAMGEKLVDRMLRDNDALHEMLQRQWTGPEANEFLSMALERLEPEMIEIGRVVFEDGQGGFSPEFMHVLRVMLLRQDRRLMVIRPVGADPERPQQVSLTRPGQMRVVPAAVGERFIPGLDVRSLPEAGH